MLLCTLACGCDFEIEKGYKSVIVWRENNAVDARRTSKAVGCVRGGRCQIEGPRATEQLDAMNERSIQCGGCSWMQSAMQLDARM